MEQNADDLFFEGLRVMAIFIPKKKLKQFACQDFGDGESSLNSFTYATKCVSWFTGALG